MFLPPSVFLVHIFLNRKQHKMDAREYIETYGEIRYSKLTYHRKMLSFTRIMHYCQKFVIDNLFYKFSGECKKNENNKLNKDELM